MKLCILTEKNENIFATVGDEVIISGIRIECYFSPHPTAELARQHTDINAQLIKYTVRGRTLHLLTERAAFI